LWKSDGRSDANFDRFIIIVAYSADETSLR